MKQFDLPVVNDIQKSFYGKAEVTELDNGDIELTSYNTVANCAHNVTEAQFDKELSIFLDIRIEEMKENLMLCKANMLKEIRK